MNSPDGYKFSKEHTWAHERDGLVYVGISHYAQTKLSTVVFVDVPPAGDTVAKDEPICAVESLKSVSDVHAPVSGTVETFNEALDINPGALNNAPYETWIAAIRPSDLSELGTLMTEDEYNAFCNK